MAAKNTGTREIPYHHRENAEWLTSSICSEYRKRASQLGDSSYSARRDLQRELQHRCDITELEALNIINGYHADQYVVHYERMRNHVVVEEKEPEYLEWLKKKETEEARKPLGEFEIEEKD